MKLFKKKEKGASSVEYAIVILLICIVVITAVSFLGFSTKTAFETTTEAFKTVQQEETGNQGKCKDSDADKDCGIGND